MNQTTNPIIKTSTTNNTKLSKTTKTVANDPQIYKNGKPVAVPGFAAGHVFLTIAGAVNSAQSGDTIMLANGGTFDAYNITISKNLNFNVFNNGKATINAQYKGSIFLINPGVTVTLQNLILENGNATSGGAIYNKGDLIVKNCIFKNNEATSVFVGGGAIFNKGILNVVGSTFTANNETYSNGAIYNEDKTSITSDNFTNNSGSALYNANGTLNILGCTFIHDQAGTGGAIQNDVGTVNVDTSTFKDNTAVTDGGVIYNNDKMSINKSIFTDNLAGQYGGAICNVGVLTVTKSTFTGGTLTNYGGVIENVGTLTLKENTFDNNVASRDGGVIYNYGGTILANFNRIVGNNATLGSAIYNDGGNINATLNWWGYNTLANITKQIYNTNGGTVTYNPWIILTINANPTNVHLGGSSTVTAELQYSSDGKYHNPIYGAVPYTGSANFKATKGTILNYKISGVYPHQHVTLFYFANGKATSTLTNLTTAGLTNVSAKVDNQLVTTSVIIQ